MFFCSSGFRHLHRKSAFLLVFCISLFLLFSSSGCHERGKWSPFIIVSASPGPYEIPLQESFPQVVGEAASCKTCQMMLANTLRQVDMYMKAKKKDSISFFEVDDFLEYTCNPYTSVGSWIRQLFFLIQNENATKDTQENEEESRFKFTPLVVDFVTKCNHACATVQERCEYFLAQSYFDDLSKTIANMSEKPSTFFSEENYNYLLSKFCTNTSFCVEENMLIERVSEELNNRESRLRDVIFSDEIKIVNQSDYGEEFTAFNDLPGKRVTEPFTVDELETIREMGKEAREKIQKEKEKQAELYPSDKSTCPWINGSTDSENTTNSEKQVRNDDREDL